MPSGVYEIVCAPTGKRYVGSAKDFSARWRAHRGHLARGTHHSPHLQAAWAKHGAEAFVFRPLLICAPANAVMYEQIALDALGPQFNVARVAGSCLGVKHSAETRAKHSASKIGNTHARGKAIHTAESKAAIAAALTGNTHTKGRARDRAAVEATAAAHRGMKRSDETRRRISAAVAGKKQPPRPEAWRAAISAALKGKRMSQASIDKMAATKRGTTLSEEHKARIGAASRAAWAKRKAGAR
jgi:group I intron endonuclease